MDVQIRSCETLGNNLDKLSDNRQDGLQGALQACSSWHGQVLHVINRADDTESSWWGGSPSCVFQLQKRTLLTLPAWRVH